MLFKGRRWPQIGPTPLATLCKMLKDLRVACTRDHIAVPIHNMTHGPLCDHTPEPNHNPVSDLVPALPHTSAAVEATHSFASVWCSKGCGTKTVSFVHRTFFLSALV